MTLARRDKRMYANTLVAVKTTTHTTFSYGWPSPIKVLFSVTRFGEILPLWHNFKSIGQIFEGLFSIWQIIILTLAKMLCYWASFHCYRRPDASK